MFIYVEESSSRVFGEDRAIALHAMLDSVVHMLDRRGKLAVTASVAVHALRIFRKVRVHRVPNSLRIDAD